MALEAIDTVVGSQQNSRTESNGCENKAVRSHHSLKSLDVQSQVSPRLLSVVNSLVSHCNLEVAAQTDRWQQQEPRGRLEWLFISAGFFFLDQNQFCFHQKGEKIPRI